MSLLVNHRVNPWHLISTLDMMHIDDITAIGYRWEEPLISSINALNSLFVFLEFSERVEGTEVFLAQNINVEVAHLKTDTKLIQS